MKNFTKPECYETVSSVVPPLRHIWGTESVIEVTNVTKTFGSGADAFTALKEVSVTIRQNEFFTLLGPSGCGKTTLLRTIAGFIDPTSGSLSLEGRDILGDPPYLRPVNTVFQNYALFPHMTVAQNVGFGLEMLDKPRSEVQATVREMLELVKMTQLADRQTSEISGGQQQRVALARALAPKPKVLLLDEPLSALDFKLRKEMQIELKRLQSETGITFVFVTHDQEEALTMSDRIAVMSNGELQQLGLARDIYERPRNMFVADFIGETNLLEVSVDTVEAGRATCHLGGGHALSCDAVDGIGAGAKVHMSIRPERLFLSDTATDGQSLKGTVRENIFIGTDISTVVDLDGGLRFTVRTSNSERGQKGIFEPGHDVFINMEQGAPRLLVD